MKTTRVAATIVSSALGFYLFFESCGMARMNIIPHLRNNYPGGIEGWVRNTLSVLRWHPWDNAFTIGIGIAGLVFVGFGIYVLAWKR